MGFNLFGSRDDSNGPVSDGVVESHSSGLVVRLRAICLTPIFPDLRSKILAWLRGMMTLLITAWTSRIAIGLSLIWFVLALCALLFAMTIDRSSFRAESLPDPARWALICYELTILAFVIVAFGAPLATARERWLRKRRSGALSYKLLVLTVRGTVVVAALFYILSWVTFWSWGNFLDVASLRFWLESPVLLFQHVAQLDPLMLVTVPPASLVGVACSIILLERIVRWPSIAARLIPILAGIIVFLTYSISSEVGEEFSTSPIHTWDRDFGSGVMLGDHFATLRAERTGPLSRMISDIREALATHATPAGTAPDAFVSPPIVTMPEYLSGVDLEAVAEQPNVIIVVIESLVADQLLAYGADRDVMPNINALAREGRVFTNHLATASHSNYSSVVPLSAHYPLRSPRYHIYPKNPSYPRVMIYDILKEVGYRTAVFSSQNEVWGGMINLLQTGRIDHFLHSETYSGPTYVPTNDVGFFRFVKGTKRSGKIDDRYTVQEALKWIEHGGTDPFFIYMNLQTAHVPYELPADFPPRFGSGEVSFPIRFNYFPPDSAAAVIDIYANSLAYVDHQLGRLFDHLREQGRLEQTVIVVTGDHGQAFFEHGFAAHSNQLYEELLRTPLIIRGPGVNPGLDDRPAQQIDVPPSILHLLGLPPHPGHQGVDLFTPEFDSDRPMFAVVQSPMAHQYAVVRSGFKLMRDVRHERFRLYDLANDPGETNDLMEELPEVAGELEEILNAWSTAQIQYYASIKQHRQFYPPRLVD